MKPGGVDVRGSIPKTLNDRMTGYVFQALTQLMHAVDAGGSAHGDTPKEARRRL